VRRLEARDTERFKNLESKKPRSNGCADSEIAKAALQKFARGTTDPRNAGAWPYHLMKFIA